MLKIEYKIQLNDAGRPCIDLSPTYQDKAEDKFFSIELARYVLQETYDRRSAEFDAESGKIIEQGIALLAQVGDQIAEIIYYDMMMLGNTAMAMGERVHVQTIEDRNKINKFGIVEKGKLFTRQEGLMVNVIQDDSVYVLTGGITNDHWVKIEQSEESNNKVVKL